MKTSTIVAVLAVLIVAGGAWYYFMMPQGTAAPSGAAGINGSPNQGNLGQPDNGQVQQPGTTGTTQSAAQDNGVGDGSQRAATLNIESSAQLGDFIAANNGMTLYTYAPDTKVPGHSACTDQCAKNWPPYMVSLTDTLKAPAGVTGKLATISRPDATRSLQVTYKGMPLYFYIKDTKAGDTAGQGVGGVWYVVKP